MALQQSDSTLYSPDDPLFIDSVIHAESSGNPNAVGPMTRYGQAKGLMQILDSTFAEEAEEGDDIFNPDDNRRVGTKYLKKQYINNDEDIRLALAAYNWGPGNLRKAQRKYGDSWEDIAAYAPEETRNYIDKILSHYETNLKKKDTREFPEIKQAKSNGVQDTDSFNRPALSLDDIGEGYRNQAQAPASSNGQQPLGIGTSKEFADAYYDVAANPEYETLTFPEKMESLASLYNSRKWDADTFDLVKDLSDYLLYGASPDELNEMLGAMHSIAGPPPTIADDDNYPEQTMQKWHEDAYSRFWENDINPAYFGSHLDRYLNGATERELNAYATRNRSMLGQGAHWIKETVRSVGRGGVRGYSDPAAGATRLAGAGETADFLADVPDVLGRPSQDYLYETDEAGYLILDDWGRPIPKLQGTIAEAVGQIGSFLLGGAALKGVGVSARGIMGAMGGVNTLAVGEQSYQEAKSEGATEDQAMTAALLSLPIGAVTSLGSYAVVANKFGMTPAIKGLSAYNKAKVIAPFVLKNSLVEGVTEALEQTGQSAAVSQTIGRNVITWDKIKTAFAAGTIAGGLFKFGEVWLQSPEAPPITFKDVPPKSPLEPDQLALPAPEEKPPGLPAPEEQPKLPGQPERKTIGGFDYTEGPQAAVRSYEPLAPDEQVAVGEKLEAFQRSDSDVLHLTKEQAAALTPEMLRTLHMEVIPEDGGVAVSKNTSYIPVDSDEITGVNNLISDLQKRLENTPSPDAVPDLIRKRSQLKQQYKEQAKSYERAVTEAVKERSKMQRDLNAKKAEYESQTDRTLKQVARLELTEIEESIAAFDAAHKGVYNAWQKLAPIEEQVTTVNSQIKAALDPANPYANDISAIQKNIKGLINKRRKLEAQQRDAQAAAFNEEVENVRQAKENVLTELGVEDPTTIPDISMGVNVEGFKVVPYNNKWFVVDANGEPLGRGHDYFYDAAETIKAHEGVLYDQKTGKPQFVTKEPIPDRVALSPETVKQIEETVAKSKLNKAAAAKKAKELYEKEYKKQVAANKKKLAAEAKAKKEAKKPKGGKIVTEQAKAAPGTMSNVYSEKGAAETTVKPDQQTTQRTVPVTSLSVNRIIYSNAKKPLSSNYTPEVQFAGDATKPIKPKEVFLAAQKIAQTLAHNTRILVGGAVDRNVLGFLHFVKNYIKVGRHDDIATAIHEMTHAIDRAVIGKWDVFGVGDYSHLSPEVRAASRDMYDTFYGDDGKAEPHVQIAEGLALFFQHYATGQPVRKEILNWYKSDFAQENPKLFKDMENLKAMAYAYQNQTPLTSLTSRIEEPASGLKKAIKQFTFQKYYDDWHDRWHAIKQASPEAYKEWVTNYKRAAGIVANAIHGETADIFGNKINLPNLKTALAPAAGKHKELVAYLVARRAGAYAMAGIEPGIPLKDAASVIADIEKNHADVALAARNYYQWVTNVMHPLLKQTSDRGAYLVDRIQQDNIKTTGAAHGYYVPFKRAGNRSLNAFKRRKGSTKSVVDPLTEIQRAFTDTLDAGFKQRALEILMQQASDRSVNSIGTYVREITPGSQRIGLEKEFKKRVDALKQEGDPESTKDLEYMTALFEPEFPGVSGSDFRTYLIMDKNKPRFFEVDPRLVKAMDDSLNTFFTNPAYGALVRMPANILRPAATAFRVAFQLKQLVRDPINAWHYLQSEGLGIGDLAKLYLYTVNALFDQIGYHTGLRRKGSHFGLADRLGVATFHQAGSERLLAAQAKGTKVAKALDLGGLSWKKVEQWLSTPELGVRVAAMRLQMEKMGITDPDAPLTAEQALLLAETFRESTTNFTRQGAKARHVNLGVPFFTARIAELTRIPRDIKRNPAKLAAYGAGMLTAGLWYALSNSDEDWYNELEPEAKADRIWMKANVGGVDKLMFMPLDSKGGTMWTIGQAIGNAMAEADSASPSVVDYAKALMHTHAPLSSIEDLLGVLGKEYLALKNNYDNYFKRKIVPPSLEYQDPRIQYSASTSELAKRIGMASGISPMKIDHAIRNTVPAASGIIRFSEKALGLKKSKEDNAMNFFVSSFSRSGTAQGVMDRSQRMFTDKLIEYRANRSAETEEEAEIRKKLEKINRTVSDYNTVIYGIDDQKLRDELREKKRDILRLGIEIGAGASTEKVGSSPMKKKADSIRKERKAERSKTLKTRKEELKKKSALKGDTL